MKSRAVTSRRQARRDLHSWDEAGLLPSLARPAALNVSWASSQMVVLLFSELAQTSGAMVTLLLLLTPALSTAQRRGPVPHLVTCDGSDLKVLT